MTLVACVHHMTAPTLYHMTLGCQRIHSCELIECTMRRNSRCLRCLEGYLLNTTTQFDCTCKLIMGMSQHFTTPLTGYPSFSPSVQLLPTVWNNGLATISCAATGWPLPTVKWYFRSGREHRELNNTMVKNIDDFTLTITGVTSIDGYYMCEASNSVGSIRIFTRYLVHCKSIINNYICKYFKYLINIFITVNYF